MARTNSLADFLADIAAAIKEKKSDSTSISASDFDTEILALPSVDTSDANATASDIKQYKLAYVNGQKVVGTVPDKSNQTMSASGVRVQGNSVISSYNFISNGLYVAPNNNFAISAGATTVANAAGLTADKLIQGVTVLGVTGTHNPYQMRVYTSVTTMNNDLANIPEGDVVKVIEGNVTTLYVKETTMKQLIKAEDTISQEEYEELNDVADNILGE